MDLKDILNPDPLPSPGLSSASFSSIFDPRGSLDLTEEIILRVQDDKQALHALSLTSKSFAEPARRILFRSLKLMDDISVGRWQIELQRLALQQSTVPLGLTYVKDFSFSLDRKRNLYIIDFMQSVQGLLTLDTIRVCGRDGLFCMPEHTWFVDFVKSTQANTLTFNGAHIADYILKFDCPSVRFLEFNYCRVYYISDDLKTEGPRRGRLTALVALRAEGTGWQRVERISSASLNSEALNLVKDASVGLDSLEIKVISNGMDMTPDLALSNNIGRLQSLCLQVPSVALYTIPDFAKELLCKAPRLRHLSLFYERGWYLACPWQTLYKQVMKSVHSALTGMSESSLENVSFRFQDALYKPHIVKKEESGNILVTVEYDNKPPIHQGTQAQLAGNAYLLLGRANLLACNI
ncbi:hypothetical protein CVT26_015071 [Gymnopilus dilepis]|uniref:F-box domain-containing protein n=1 Tax=Gymnopilus dilepis TaxID=231916 RepID=A0A409WXI9_9AGAR|nr:hypothetical protein CVT26_015071 [Gymnopilus dilepis]